MNVSPSAEAVVRQLQDLARGAVDRREASTAEVCTAAQYLAGIYSAAQIEALIYQGADPVAARAQVVAQLVQQLDDLRALAPPIRVNRH